MKASSTKLGLELQLFLLKNGCQEVDLARVLQINNESLSNMIHGRRRFKDDILHKLADSPVLQNGGMTLRKLRAYRALDDYSMEEILLALVESFRDGRIAQVPEAFLQQLHWDLELSGFPPAMTPQKNALLAFMQFKPEARKQVKGS